MEGSIDALGSAPRTVFFCVRAEACELSSVSVMRGSWEWYGMVVPNIWKLWNSNVMGAALGIFLWKYVQGCDVGLAMHCPTGVGPYPAAFNGGFWKAA